MEYIYCDAKLVVTGFDQSLDSAQKASVISFCLFPDSGAKIEDRRRRGALENEMVGWHHQLNGHESEQIPGDGEGQGGLACCSPWGRKESDTTERLNSSNRKPACSTRFRVCHA